MSNLLTTSGSLVPTILGVKSGTNPNATEREIFRHPSNNGSVVVFNMFDQTIRLLVLDSKYRAAKKWGEFGVNATGRYFTSNLGNIISPEAASDRLTDAEIQRRFSSLRNDDSAANNTAKMIEAKSEAATWCNEQLVKGFGPASLPNQYQGIVIWLEAKRLDALDPSVSEYPEFALSTGDKMEHFWVSSQMNDSFAHCIKRTPKIGLLTALYKNYELGVAPVIEL